MLSIRNSDDSQILHPKQNGKNQIYTTYNTVQNLLKQKENFLSGDITQEKTYSKCPNPVKERVFSVAIL